MADHALVTWLIMHWSRDCACTDYVTDHALTICLSCNDLVADHTLIPWLIIHWSRGSPALITWLIAVIRLLHMHWSHNWSCNDYMAIMQWSRCWSFNDPVTDHALITRLIMHWLRDWSGTDHVAIIHWSRGCSCTYLVTDRTLMTWLSWTDHVTAHALIT